jgi:hypothetical protein
MSELWRRALRGGQGRPRLRPLIDAADITVKNASGQVALNGTVPRYPQYLEAAAAAPRVAGVTDVDDHLEVVLPDSDYRDDAMLTTAANKALTLNVTVPHRQPGYEEAPAICLLAAGVSQRRRSRFY